MWGPSTRFWIACWWRRPDAAALLVALLAAALGASACVTRGAHERALEELRAELAQAQQEAVDKDRSIGALEEERAKLLGEIAEMGILIPHRP